jgi:hypothetical protein
MGQKSVDRPGYPVLVKYKNIAKMAIPITNIAKIALITPLFLLFFLISKEPQPAPSYWHGCQYPVTWM